MKLFSQTKFQLIVICLLTFFAYSNIFQNKFVGDDLNLIVNWDFIHHAENLPQIFVSDIFPGSYARYRPVSSTILLFLYQLSGLNTVGYHLFSLLVHIAATILVYFITKQIVLSIMYNVLSLKTRLQNAKYPLPFTLYPLPFLTALLFGLHPIHTEAITFMMASIDSTGLLFYLAAFYLYLKKKRLTSVIFAALAIFTNEMAATLPLVIVFYDLVFEKNKPKLNSWVKYLPYFLPVVIYFIIRIFFLKLLGGDFTYFGNSFYLTMLTMTKALVKYMQELVWPVGLSAYPHVAEGIESYVGPIAPQAKILSQSILDPDIMLNIFLFLSLTFLAYKSRKKFPVITFGIGWFFITFIPALNIIPVGNVMQERYAYLPSFGFILLLVGGLEGLGRLGGLDKKNLPPPTSHLLLVSCLISLISSFYILQTYQRNKDYKDQLTFWAKLATQVPNNPLINYYLAGEYQLKNQDDPAIKYFLITQNLAPNTPDIYNRLGQIYQKRGELDQAKINYAKALSLYPDFTSAKQVLNNLFKINDGSNLKITRPDGIWNKYQDSSLLFFYPEDFVLTPVSESELALSKDQFTIRITKDKQTVKAIVNPLNSEQGKVSDLILGSLTFN